MPVVFVRNSLDLGYTRNLAMSSRIPKKLKFPGDWDQRINCDPSTFIEGSNKTTWRTVVKPYIDVAVINRRYDYFLITFFALLSALYGRFSFLVQRYFIVSVKSDAHY